MPRLIDESFARPSERSSRSVDAVPRRCGKTSDDQLCMLPDGGAGMELDGGGGEVGDVDGPLHR